MIAGLRSGLLFGGLVFGAADAASATPEPRATLGAWTLERVLEAVRAGEPGVTAARRAAEAARRSSTSPWTMISPRIRVEALASRSDDPALLFSRKLQQGRFTAEDFELDALNDPDPRTALEVGIRLEQPLFHSGRETTAPALHAARTAAADASERAAIADRLLDAVAAYAGALRARDALDADSIGLLAAEELRRASVERFRRGQVPELDTLRATTRLAEERLVWLTSRKRLAVALTRLAGMVGEPVHAAALVDPTEAPAHSERSAEPPGEVARKRAEYRAASEHAEALAVEVRRATLAFLPSLGAQLDWRHHRDPGSGEGTARLTLGLAASLPIWDGLERARDRGAARARAEEARARAEMLRRALATEIEEAELDAALARDRLDTARLAEVSSGESLRLALARYRAGLLPQSDLLSIHAEAARSRRAVADARALSLLARYRARHARGDLR